MTKTVCLLPSPYNQCVSCRLAVQPQGARRKEEKLGRVFAGEGDVMEEHERDKVEQNALQVWDENCSLDVLRGRKDGCHSHCC